MEFYRLTSSTLPGFLPLLPADVLEQLEQREDVYAMGAVEAGRVWGVLVFRSGPVQLEVLWLAVAEDCRRRGCATGMLRWLCGFARKKVIPVTCSFAVEDGEEPICYLFEHLPDFTLTQEEGQVFTIPVSLLDHSPMLDRLKGAADAQPLFSLPRHVQRTLFQGESGLSARQEDYLPELCLCALEGERVKAAVLFQPGQQADELYLAYAFCRPEASRALLALFAAAAERIRGSDPACQRIQLAAATPAAQVMVQKLFPEAVPAAGYYLACWDMDY